MGYTTNFLKSMAWRCLFFGMTLLKKNLQFVIGFCFWIFLLGIFLLWRLTTNVDASTPEIIDPISTWDIEEVTAQEELEAQLEFKDKNDVDVTHEAAPIPSTLTKYDYTVWGDWLDPIVNYAYEQTKDLPHPDWWLMWLDLVKTWSMENTRFSAVQEWAADEKGICQLRYRYHKTFMDTQDFFDPYKQVDYCIEVYMDRYNRTRHNGQKIHQVRAARSIRDRASSRFKLL